eukprot:CAMPEP_0176032792 /NCGR_PEP_ID=MMETSP0120_2-20121206/16190_1 /TAXON_ID=160619 /ORGANISM="Kryptoperidinium foliaceum, Strain CCMP 1326" /LENGTH=130 /DNA_ID=CAMNT_0017366113 /DNA_START=735 /DNA_END=1128 /DNA_ORIENTATION=+
MSKFVVLDPSSIVLGGKPDATPDSGCFIPTSTEEESPPVLGLVGVDVLPEVVAEFGGGEEPVSLDLFMECWWWDVSRILVTGRPGAAFDDSKYDSPCSGNAFWGCIRDTDPLTPEISSLDPSPCAGSIFP